MLWTTGGGPIHRDPIAIADETFRDALTEAARLGRKVAPPDESHSAQRKTTKSHSWMSEPAEF